MNDFLEVDHAFRIFQDHLYAQYGFPLGTKYRQVYNAAKTALSRVERGDVYVASLTENEDQLSQWRGYTPPGAGICIGIDSDQLVKSDGVDLLPCEYAPTSQSQLVRELLENLTKEFDPRRDRESDLATPAESVVRTLHEISPLLKHPTFAEESEWRIVARHEPDREVKFRARSGQLVRYVEIPIPDVTKFFHELIVGPTVEPALAEGNLSALVESFGFSCDISHSEIPFRSW